MSASDHRNWHEPFLRDHVLQALGKGGEGNADMPSTVSDLLDAASLRLTGVVPWLKAVPSRAPGVYILSLSPDSDRNSRVLETAPIDCDAVSQWISRVPMLELDGRPRPSPDALTRRLSEFWLSDESTLYIGKASSLRNRVRGYYKTPLGDRRPHAGGHWIKTLSILSETFVYYAESSDPEEAESRLIRAFITWISSKTKHSLRDAEHPLPFANLEFPKGNRKNHGIAKSKLLE